ncbi:tellurite resistance/C4-dicarboxylate transporter family protein [Nocardia sp. NPDC051030]|uniref:tellurite resistance/C4-dicarboxylate transporter family protein n=1 Tax=Nocardia sp. NPDC051030 TaxID=3155162 RepID=UPI0034194A49
MTDRSWRELPPAAGAFVMATGIVSIGLHLVRWELLSRILLVIAAAVWVVLTIDFTARMLFERSRWLQEAETPPALTAVAATTVLGTRLALLGWQDVADIALVLAVVVWPGLLFTVVRHWNRRMPGAAFLVCVATQGLAVLSGTLSAAHSSKALAIAALIWFCLGVVLYVVACTHFDFRQIRTGAGDQWVATGALAISALAASKLLATHRFTGWLDTALHAAVLTLLVLNWVIYMVLLIAEVVEPRPGYNIRRWATVFPLGMTAVATLSTGTVVHLAPLSVVGRVLLVVAVAVWLLTCMEWLGTVQLYSRAR